MMTRFSLRLALAVFVLGVLGLTPARAQVSASELLVRLDQLENQVRQLTGMVEQLQYRNQQLESNLRKTQEDYEFRFQELGGKSGSQSTKPTTPSHAAPPPQQQQRSESEPPSYLPPPSQPAYGGQPPQPAYVPPPNSSGRRSDAFDPSQSPNAPGAPRPLGSRYASGNAGEAAPPGHQPGAPIDLAGGRSQSGLPPPPARNPNATGAMATLAPSQTPRDEYDLAYGYLVRKDYDLADQSFRAFLGKYPKDRLAEDAQYGLGESLFQRQNYRDAADAFLTMTRDHASSPRAPEAMIRLGQSLAAMNQKDMACGAYAEVGRKYPQASPGVKRAVVREQKRAGC